MSALAIVLEGCWVLMDCGEGTQYRIMSASLRPSQLESIFISHLHGDHLFGLPGLISTFSLQGRKDPLHVHGPPGIRSFLDETLKAVSTHLTYPLNVHEVSPGVVRETSAYRMESLPLEHRIPTMGYLFIRKSDPPLRIAYCSDTKPCESSIRLARDADLLIHEATYLDQLAGKAHERGHTTAREAARIAAAAGARKLLLTHFSPRYRELDPLVEEAREVFPSTEAARDLTPLDVGAFLKAA